MIKNASCMMNRKSPILQLFRINYALGSKIPTICLLCQRNVLLTGGNRYASLSPGQSQSINVALRTRYLQRLVRNLSTNNDKKPTVELKDLKKKNTRFGPVSWKSMGISLTLGAIVLAAMLWQKKKKEEAQERMRRQAIGKSKIGGPWELQCHDGKQMSSKDFLGKWVLIYFGFTHCPDICPDELEKMCKVAQLLEADAPTKIEPLFFTVDPERDTAERVKKYCEEFSPDLIGFTGTPDQVKKVSRTFRVYHSEGPRDDFNDYIVDHTVIMYLMDPEGNFVDYYGQNKQAEEIASGIRLQMLKFDKGKKKGWF